MDTSHTRHIVIVITDGEPNNKGLATKAIAMGKKLGFELYGINIRHTNKFIPNTEIITNINELPNALYGMLKDTITADIKIR